MRGPDPKADDQPVRLGDRLIEAGLITRGELDSTLDLLRENGLSHRRLGRTLVDLGFLSDRELLKVLGTHFGMPVAPFPVSDAEPGAIKEVPVELARRHRLIACRLASGSLSVAAPGPVDPEVIKELGRLTGHSIQVYLASEREIEAGLAKFHPEPGSAEAKPISSTNGGSSPLPDTVKPPAATAPPARAEKAAPVERPPAVERPTPGEKPASLEKPAVLEKPTAVGKPAMVEKRAPAGVTAVSETFTVHEAASAAAAIATAPAERGGDLRERGQRYAAQTRQFATALQRITEDNEQFVAEVGDLQREWEGLRQDNLRLQQEVDRARDDNMRLRKEFERVREEKDRVLAAVAKFAEETLGKPPARS